MMNSLAPKLSTAAHTGDDVLVSPTQALAWMGDGLVILDRDGRIAMANDAMARMLKLKRGELLQSPLEDHLADAELLKVVGIDQLLQLSGVERLQVVFADSEGEVIPASVTAAPVPASAAQHLACVLVCRDNLDLQEFLNESTRMAAAEIERAAQLDKAKTAAEEREQMQIELGTAQKLESIGQLAAGIAHEINTPVQFIGDNVAFMQRAFGMVLPLLEAFSDLEEPEAALAQADQVRQKLKSSKMRFLLEQVPKALDQTMDGIAHVSKIVGAMKEFSHPSSEEMRLTDLHQCIESTVTVARNEWKYVADLVRDFDPDLPPVPCHTDAFNQVILNIVINAAHAIADARTDEDAKGTIRIRTRHVPPYAEVRISDTGTGIPESHVARIFDPFFTTKEVGRGTGQGLAIAYSVVVKRHHGEIDVETEPGKGTTFILRFPLEMAHTLQPES